MTHLATKGPTLNSIGSHLVTKDELEARSESKTGNKAWLRRRLHGAIIWTSARSSGHRGLDV